jgi:cellulose synthase/poly-beta-1,6-N-acetylglucosamine synthase-like glycosyltransferase
MAISEDKLISVIIPACNEENVIGNIVSDLVCPSCKNLEILVIAHNCQDGTVNKARMINNEKVKVIEFNTTSSGKALALNEGLTEARGEIIVQFDADNRIKDPYYLSKLLSYFEKDPELAAVQSRLVASNPKDSLISLLQDTEYEIFSAISWSGRDVLKLPCFLAGTGVALKKETLEELCGWHNSLVEDFELFTRLSLKNKRICYADNLSRELISTPHQ